MGDEVRTRHDAVGMMLAEVIGIVEGPPDLAANHGHYAHGKPKP